MNSMIDFIDLACTFVFYTYHWWMQEYVKEFKVAHLAEPLC